MAANHQTARWVTFAVMMFLLLVVMVLVMAVLVSSNEGSDAYCVSFDSTDLGTFTKIGKTTLYPYSGTWNTLELGATEQQCLDSCSGDANCMGFFRVNENGSTSSQGNCFFYTANNAQSMVTSQVELSPFFVTSDLVVGGQLPAESTDTYVKNSKEWIMFRSGFLEAETAST